ncbi:MAG: CyaY protein [Polaribacter sp.]
MNESKFNQLAEETMIAIEEAIEASGADIDYDNVADILTLEFPNRSRVIINKQTPLSQIWVAAKSGGYHFDFNEKSSLWCLNTSAEKELFTQLSLYCSEQLGETVELNSES